MVSHCISSLLSVIYHKIKVYSEAGQVEFLEDWGELSDSTDWVVHSFHFSIHLLCLPHNLMFFRNVRRVVRGLEFRQRDVSLTNIGCRRTHILNTCYRLLCCLGLQTRQSLQGCWQLFWFIGLVKRPRLVLKCWGLVSRILPWALWKTFSLLSSWLLDRLFSWMAFRFRWCLDLWLHCLFSFFFFNCFSGIILHSFLH